MTVDVYKRYYEAKCVFNGVKRKAAVVALTSDSEAGMITYTVSANFFPHKDAEDFAVSYDAYAEKVVFSGKGRRSKKREAALLKELETYADEAAAGIGGNIFWDKPIGEARLG